MRNHAVLHIVAEEARIFRTKERAPLLLCLEVYRPTEIAFEKIPGTVKGFAEKQSELRDEKEKLVKKLSVHKKRPKTDAYAAADTQGLPVPSRASQSFTGTESYFTSNDLLQSNAKGWDEDETGNLYSRLQMQQQSKAQPKPVHTTEMEFTEIRPSKHERRTVQVMMHEKTKEEERKRFSKVRNIEDSEKQREEFGQIMDLRASNAHLIKDLFK